MNWYSGALQSYLRIYLTVTSRLLVYLAQDLNTGLSEVKTQIDPEIRNSEYQGKQSLSPPLSLPRYTDRSRGSEEAPARTPRELATVSLSLGWAAILCRSGLGDGGKRVRRAPGKGV